MKDKNRKAMYAKKTNQKVVAKCFHDKKKEGLDVTDKRNIAICLAKGRKAE